MIRTFSALSVAAGLGVLTLAFPAFAAPSGVSGEIELAQSSRSLPLTYGSSVQFTATASGRMDPKGYLAITVVCSQDAAAVYQWSSRDLAFAFPLVDQEGQGLQWDGAAASCQAGLVYRADKKSAGTVQILDTVSFDVQ